MRTLPFLVISLVVAGLVFAGALAVGNDYIFFAGYVVLQYVVLSTAWNILGGYCGYVNFGTGAFFALGAYSTVAIYNLIGKNELPHVIPIPVLMLVGGIVSGIVGFGMGYLTLRLRGAFFSIATLALAVVLETLIVNWDYVGGSRGAYILRPENAPLIGSYVALSVPDHAAACGRISGHRAADRALPPRLRHGHHPRRRIGGRSLRRADAALKLIATTISGALMGMAGAPFPYYIGYLQPDSTFALDYAINAIAMPLIGGTSIWIGPLIGAILLGSLQQLITVTISSAVNLLIVGCLLVAFVILAPNGIVGLFQKYFRHKDDDFVGRRRVSLDEPGAVAAKRLRTGVAGMSELLEVDNLSKRFGGFVALDNITLTVPAGERLGLIGPNGSGKSTLVNCICGTLRNEQGSVRFDGRPIDGMPAHKRTHLGLARSFQLPRPFPSMTLVDNVRIPRLYTVEARGVHRTVEEVDEHCHGLLREVGLEAKARQRPRDLTQVEMRKLELARAMAAEPKLLIADEAMAGLTHSEIDDILALLVRLNENGVTVILIEHIMSAVMSFSRRLVVLVSGRMIADGKPDEVMRNPEVEKAYLG